MRLTLKKASGSLSCGFLNENDTGYWKTTELIGGDDTDKGLLSIQRLAARRAAPACPSGVPPEAGRRHPFPGSHTCQALVSGSPPHAVLQPERGLGPGWAAHLLAEALPGLLQHFTAGTLVYPAEDGVPSMLKTREEPGTTQVYRQ